MIEKEAKELSGNVLMTKALQLQAEYMGTHQMKITVHRVPLDITGGHFHELSQVGHVA